MSARRWSTLTVLTAVAALAALILPGCGGSGPGRKVASAGIARTLAKLEAGEPVTIVTMGDSLSAKEHKANRDVLWSSLLEERLEARYGSDVTIVNPAVGGTTLDEGIALMPGWLKWTPQPDLVTVWFGYNNWSGGTTGAQFADSLNYGVFRIRRATGGASDVLLMTTCPSLGRWTEMGELAEAVRTVAAARRTGLADLEAAFHAAGTDQAAREGLYISDGVHLSVAGHQLTAATVLPD